MDYGDTVAWLVNCENISAGFGDILKLLVNFLDRGDLLLVSGLVFTVSGLVYC